jgi:DHA3 family macrolide efflux protein-like MFS transporter
MGESKDKKAEYVDGEDEYSLKGYFFFWIGQLFSLVGTLVSGFAITWWVTDLTKSAMLLALGSFLFLIFMVIFTPIAGVLGDKHSRKWIIFIADSFNAVAMGIIILLFYIDITYPILIIIINGLRGIGQAFHQPTVSAIIPSMVPKKHLSRINGVNYLLTSLIQVIGPVIGGTMYAFFPIEFILWIDIITYGMALIPLILVKIPKVSSIQKEKFAKGAKRSFFHEFKIGLRTLRIIPGLFLMLILSTFLNFLFQPLNILEPLYIKVEQLGNEIDLAVLYAFINGGLIMGGIITTLKKKWNHKVTVYFGGLMIVMSLATILALTPTGWILFASIAGACTIFMLPIVNTIYLTILQTTVPKDKMGRVTSVDYSLSFAITPIGAILAGPLGDILGTRLLFLILGLTGSLTTFCAWQFSGIKKIDYNDEKFFAKITERITNGDC